MMWPERPRNRPDKNRTGRKKQSDEPNGKSTGTNGKNSGPKQKSTGPSKKNNGPMRPKRKRSAFERCSGNSRAIINRRPFGISLPIPPPVQFSPSKFQPTQPLHGLLHQFVFSCFIFGQVRDREAQIRPG